MLPHVHRLSGGEPEGKPCVKCDARSRTSFTQCQIFIGQQMISSPPALELFAQLGRCVEPIQKAYYPQHDVVNVK